MNYVNAVWITYVVICLLGAGVLGFVFGRRDRKITIKRLKADKEMLEERNELCSNRNTELMESVENFRDHANQQKAEIERQSNKIGELSTENQSIDKDLRLWENLADYVANEFQFSGETTHVPKRIQELLDHLKQSALDHSAFNYGMLDIIQAIDESEMEVPSNIALLLENWKNTLKETEQTISDRYKSL